MGWTSRILLFCGIKMEGREGRGWSQNAGRSRIREVFGKHAEELLAGMSSDL